MTSNQLPTVYVSTEMTVITNSIALRAAQAVGI